MIENCSFCGGLHYGSTTCPYICLFCSKDIRENHELLLGRVTRCPIVGEIKQNEIIEKNNMKTIAIDFDGVIHRYTGWNAGKLNEPIEYARECINQILSSGIRVVIFSTREASVIEGWLDQYGFPRLRVTNAKPLCHVILDDRVIRFDGVWDDDLINDLVSFEPYWKEKEDA